MTDLSRPAAVDRIGARPTTTIVEADAAERDGVATRLMIPSVHALKCEFTLRRIEGGVIIADGTLEASVEQMCVITLEPFTQAVRDTFQVHFVPSGAEDPDPEPDAIDQIPYDGSAIDLGEAAVEQLALALDPYPRSPGAEMPAAAEETPGPFNALAALRRPT